MEQELIGIAGLVLVGVAIAFETYRNLREKRKPDLRFAAFYFLGSAALAYYAYGLGNMVFTALNLLVALLGLVNVYPHLRK